MKQLAQFCSAGPVTAFVAALALCASLSGPCRADFDPGTDYGELMIEAAASGDGEAGLEAEAARWGLLPVEVSPLRLAMLHQLLDTCGDLRRGTAVLRAECATPTVYRAAVVLAGRVRYLSLELDNGGEALEQALRQRFGLCLGRVGQPAVTVSFGGAPSENTICLGEDCRHYQRVTYDVPEGMPGPWPVSEPLLAVLFEAGAIKKEQIRVKTIAFNA